MDISKVKKYINRTTVVVLLTVCSFLATYSLLNVNSKLRLVKSDLEAYKLRYGLIEKEKARLDSLVIVYNKSIKDKDIVIKNKDNEINRQYKELSTLKDSINKELKQSLQVNADSSYKYINNRVKPVSDLKYRFDSVQVKNIYYNYLERDGLFITNVKLVNLNKEIQLLSSIKDNQISELKLLNNVYISKEAFYKKENEAYQIEIKGLNKQVKTQKFLKTLSNGTILGLTGYIVIKTIVK